MVVSLISALSVSVVAEGWSGVSIGEGCIGESCGSVVGVALVGSLRRLWAATPLPPGYPFFAISLGLASSGVVGGWLGATVVERERVIMLRTCDWVVWVGVNTKAYCDVALWGGLWGRV
jgi:hypothetical protein